MAGSVKAESPPPSTLSVPFKGPGDLGVVTHLVHTVDSQFTFDAAELRARSWAQARIPAIYKLSWDGLEITLLDGPNFETRSRVC